MGEISQFCKGEPEFDMERGNRNWEESGEIHSINVRASMERSEKKDQGV